MVQFTLAYVALGFAVLLLLGGLLAIGWRGSAAPLSRNQRVILLGGLGGMAALLIVSFWLRHQTPDHVVDPDVSTTPRDR